MFTLVTFLDIEVIYFSLNCLIFLSPTTQRRQTYRGVPDRPPATDRQQHPVPPSAAPPHPSEWLPSLIPTTHHPAPRASGLSGKTLVLAIDKIPTTHPNSDSLRVEGKGGGLLKQVY